MLNKMLKISKITLATIAITSCASAIAYADGSGVYVAPAPSTPGSGVYVSHPANTSSNTSTYGSYGAEPSNPGGAGAGGSAAGGAGAGGAGAGGAGAGGAGAGGAGAGGLSGAILNEINQNIEGTNTILNGDGTTAYANDDSGDGGYGKAPTYIPNDDGANTNQQIIESVVEPAVEGAKSVSTSDSTSADPKQAPPPPSALDEAPMILMSKFDTAAKKQGSALASAVGDSSKKSSNCGSGVIPCADDSDEDPTTKAKAIMLNFGSYMADGTGQGGDSLLGDVIAHPGDKDKLELYHNSVQYFMQFLNGSYNPPQMGVDTSKLHPADLIKIIMSPEYSKLQAKANSIAARSSVAAGNMLYVLNQQPSIGQSNAVFDKFKNKQYYNVLTKKLTTPEVYSKQANLLEVQQATLQTLANLGSILSKLTETNQRILASSAVRSMQMKSVSTMSSMGDKSQLKQKIQQIVTSYKQNSTDEQKK